MGGGLVGFAGLRRGAQGFAGEKTVEGKGGTQGLRRMKADWRVRRRGVLAGTGRFVGDARNQTLHRADPCGFTER